LRANRYREDPTLDPVELERKRIAEEREREAGARKRRRSSGWTLFLRLSVLASLALVFVYLGLWAGNVQHTGGPEGYVRTTRFLSTLTGAAIVSVGGGTQLYDEPTQRRAQAAVYQPFDRPADAPFVPYDAPPYEALAFAPLSPLPSWLAFAIWTLATGLAIGLSVGVLDGAVPVTRPVGWALSMAACSFLPVIRSLMLGDNTPFVLLGLCICFAALKRGYEGWAGLSLLLVALKPFLLPVVLLTLVLQRKFRALLVFAVVGALLGIVIMPAMGNGWPSQYLGFLLDILRSAPGPEAAYTWRGVAAQLTGGEGLGLAYVLLSVASVAALVLAWARNPTDLPAAPEDVYNEQEPDLFMYRPASDLQWALAGIVLVLTAAYSGPNDLMLAVFPGWILSAYAASGLWPRWLSRAWLSLLALAYVVPPVQFFAGVAGGGAQTVIPAVALLAASGLVLTTQIVISRNGGGPAPWAQAAG
jgi:hypothetical protein